MYNYLVAIKTDLSKGNFLLKKAENRKLHVLTDTIFEQNLISANCPIKRKKCERRKGTRLEGRKPLIVREHYTERILERV